MGRSWVSAMLAAVTAAVLWTSFSLLGGGGDDLKNVGMWALIYYVATFVITFVVSQVISSRKSATTT